MISIKKQILILLIVLLLIFSACSNNNQSKNNFEPENNSILKNTTSESTTLNTQEFLSKINNTNTEIIDVRAPNELRDLGIIEETKLNINIYDKKSEEKISNLKKNQTYLIYCYSGHRSENFKNYLINKGFEKVFDLKGGIRTWISEGLPTTKNFSVAQDGTIIYGLNYFK